MLLRALVHFGNAPLAFSDLSSSLGMLTCIISGAHMKCTFSEFDNEGSAIFDCALGRPSCDDYIITLECLYCNRCNSIVKVLQAATR